MSLQNHFNNLNINKMHKINQNPAKLNFIPMFNPKEDLQALPVEESRNMNGRVFKIKKKLWVINHESANEVFLNNISHFLKTGASNNWVATPAHMFSMFELIIQDPNLLQHWTSLNADGVQDDMNVFDEKLKQLILHRFDHETGLYRKVRKWFVNLKRPSAMPATMFRAGLQYGNTYIYLLPGAPEDEVDAIIPDNVLRDIMYDASSVGTQKAFEAHGKILEDETLDSVTDWINKWDNQFQMQEFRGIQNYHHVIDNNMAAAMGAMTIRRNDNKYSDQQSNRNNDDRYLTNVNDNAIHGNNGDNNNSNNNGRGKCIPDDDPCPVHPGSNHTWGQCQLNRYGDNNGGNIYHSENKRNYYNSYGRNTNHNTNGDGRGSNRDNVDEEDTADEPLIIVEGNNNNDKEMNTTTIRDYNNYNNNDVHYIKNESEYIDMHHNEAGDAGDPILVPGKSINDGYYATLTDCKDGMQSDYLQLPKTQPYGLPHSYQSGDLIMVAAKNAGPIDNRWFGPFAIKQVHVDGTLTFKRQSNVLERINIRHVKKYNPIESIS
jgi:hypothetical protein